MKPSVKQVILVKRILLKKGRPTGKRISPENRVVFLKQRWCGKMMQASMYGNQQNQFHFVYPNQQ